MSLGIGLVGARGHAGAELVRLIAAHPSLELAFVSSRARDGERVADHVCEFDGALRYAALDPAAVVAHAADIVVLALPNGKSGGFVDAIDACRPDTLVVDLSADHRFDPEWHYGLPELTRGGYRGERRIANPGCYATAMQLAIAPLADLLSAPAVCFGVSGWSGAGTAPSPRNHPDALRDNLLPYALTGHLHERETAHRLGVAVEFMPHVAPHFRGLVVTVNLHFTEPQSHADLAARHVAAYAGEPLVRVVAEAPWVSRVAGCHHAEIGGLALAPDGRRAVLVVVLDNLLKGAATQALQNINRALGFDECLGLATARPDGAKDPGDAAPSRRLRSGDATAGPPPATGLHR
jgi:N-acetyl-gamma-glutamyl-phosphate reductase